MPESITPRKEALMCNITNDNLQLLSRTPGKLQKLTNRRQWQIPDLVKHKMDFHIELDLQNCHQIFLLDSSKTVDQPNKNIVQVKKLQGYMTS